MKLTEYFLKDCESFRLIVKKNLKSDYPVFWLKLSKSKLPLRNKGSKKKTFI